MKNDFVASQVRETFLYGSPSNIHAIIAYNCFEMPDIVAKQLGQPQAEDTKAWKEWLLQRVDSHTETVKRLVCEVERYELTMNF